MKSELDSFETEVEAFETIGADTSNLDHIVNVSARADSLERGIRQINELTTVSSIEFVISISLSLFLCLNSFLSI